MRATQLEREKAQQSSLYSSNTQTHGTSHMAETVKNSCYEGEDVSSFRFYLENSNEHTEILKFVHNVLPGEFQRIGAGETSLDVLGVGSGGGEIDVQMLSLLQSVFPAVPIIVDIVEGSSELSEHFKALVAKTDNLQKISFSWHFMTSEGYEKQVKAKGDIKKFDFTHMIQVINYVDNLSETIKFFHGILKKNGCFLIIAETANGGWDILWKTYSKELCVGNVPEYRSSGEIVACLKNQGLKYEEHSIPNSFDISECFDASSKSGERLLSFMTATDHFSQSFTPEIRAGMLDLIRTKCSTEKDGKILFDCSMTGIFVHA